MGILKVGIIGTGNIAQWHMNSYKILEGVEVAACCDLSLERAKGFAEKNGIPEAYASYEEMLESTCGITALLRRTSRQRGVLWKVFNKRLIPDIFT